MEKAIWKWDRWQEEVLQHWGNITLRCGRQVGKSEVVAEKAVRFALENAGTVTLVIAASQRQSGLLFAKIKGNIEARDMGLFKEIPTLTKIILQNNSEIYSLPVGKTGAYVRGYTVDLLICDEAAYVPEVVWNSVIPMIAVSKGMGKHGHIILLSTPFGKGGYYYNTFTDPDFRQWHISSERCPRISKSFLQKERRRMTKTEYRQEYQGEFCDEWNQLFPTDLLKKQTTFIEWNKETDQRANSRFYLGVDVARYGGDENAFVIAELHSFDGKDRVRIVKCWTTERVSTVDTIGRVVAADASFNFRRVFIDDGGVGGAVTDVLIEKLGRKVVGLNNASKRVVVKDEEKKQGIFKEDLYSNALVLLENGKLELISHLGLLRSLKSITYEYGTEVASNRVKIYGDYAHLAEAMVRACWCVRDRGLDIYLY